MLTMKDIEEAIKEIDRQYELFYKMEQKICKRRNINHLRNRRFEIEFKILVSEATEIYYSVKHGSKHCWAMLYVSEVGKKYTTIRVYG